MNTNHIETEARPSTRHAAWEYPDMADVRAKATDMEQQARALIRERPIVAVLVAVGAGYVAARLVSSAMR